MSPKEQHPGHLPTFDQAEAAYREVAEYNGRYTGMGAAMANMFKGVAGGQPVEESVTEGDMQGELQGILHDETFMRAGIKLAGAGGVVENGEEERSTSQALEPYIENTELFKEFLGSTEPEDVEVGTEKTLLSAVLANLQGTIDSCFDPDIAERLDPEIREITRQRGEDALRTFIEIAPEYERLGLGPKELREEFKEEPESGNFILPGRNPSPEDLERKEAEDKKRAEHNRYKQAQELIKTQETLDEYVKYWGKDLLPEFIVANRWQYLKPPEEQLFGPAAWHTDGCQYLWRDAIGFVSRLEGEDRTREFGESVRRNLLGSLDVALGSIDDASETSEFVTRQRADLANLRNALAGQPYSAEDLEAYITP